MPKKATKKLKLEPKLELLTADEQRALNAEIRLDNLTRRKNGQPSGRSFAVVDMSRSKKQLTPIVAGLGDRSKVKPAIQGGFIPFLDASGHLAKIYEATDAISSDDLPQLEKKIRKKIEQEKDYLNSYYGHYGTILPEYDQYEPFTMLDTESYLMQALRRKHSLMFRQGFKIQGENSRFTKYINTRLNTIGYMMGTTVENFIKDILHNLLVISNCFLLKIRDEDASGGVPNKKNDDRNPVAGYMILPPHSIFPFVNQKGEIIKWRRYYGSARKYKDYKLEDVIHFKWDVKPGHVYGTPRTVSVRDDIFALRRLEENVEMLLINHLFPLFHVKVGSEDAPAQMLVDGITEVDLIKAELENMPKEGVFVTDERVVVDIVGIKGEAPDPQEIMTHYKARIFTGLGVSPIDMGETDTGNRACYSEDTETLTDRGWKHYWEIDKDKDKIGTVNPITHILEFHKSTDAYLYDYKGEMIHFKNRNVDVLVTPDHDMFVGSPSTGKDRKFKINWSKTKADNINIKNFRFKSSVFWESKEDPKWFELPEVPYTWESDRYVNTNIGNIIMSDWLEFLGYFVSEGSLAAGKNLSKWPVNLSQSNMVNPQKVKKMRDCLDRLPFKYNEWSDSEGMVHFNISCKSLYIYLEKNCGSTTETKHLPEEILKYSKKLLKIVFEACMLGDGTSDKREGRTSRTYYSKSTFLINQIQEIGLKLGFRSHVLPGSRVQRVVFSYGDASKVRTCDLTRINYEGKVYCFNVPNHLFITRRNGRIGIHGNTAENVSQNLKDSVKSDLNWFCGQFKSFIIKELFEENPTNLSVQNAILDVDLIFPDVDVDGHIKWENHVIEKFNNHLLTEDEARRETNKIPMTPKQQKNTHYELHVKDLAISTIREKNQGMIEAQYVRGAEAAGKSSPGSKANKGAKSVANKNRPANQHGRALGPTSARSSMDPNLIYDLLIQELGRLKGEDKLASATWGKASSIVIDKYIESWLREDTGIYYTNQDRTEIDAFCQRLKDRVSLTMDPDIISILLSDLVEQFFEDSNAEESTESTSSAPDSESEAGPSAGSD